MIIGIVDYEESGVLYESFFKFPTIAAADKWARAIFKDGYLAIDQQLLPISKRFNALYLYIPASRIVGIRITEEGN